MGTKVLLVLATVVAAVAALAPAATAAEPVRLSFDKSISDPAAFVWSGSVAGDAAGGLTTRLTGLRVAGPIWQVRFDWVIDAGDRSFVAELSGTLNTKTGRVVMNGVVSEGWLLGAQVHEQGQLVDSAAALHRRDHPPAGERLTVATYLVETYLPRPSRDAFRALAERVRLAAEAVSRDGTPVEHLRSVFVPDEETCFHFFAAAAAAAAAASAEAVGAAGARAQLLFDRVAEAVE